MFLKYALYNGKEFSADLIIGHEKAQGAIWLAYLHYSTLRRLAADNLRWAGLKWI